MSKAVSINGGQEGSTAGREIRAARVVLIDHKKEAHGFFTRCLADAPAFRLEASYSTAEAGIRGIASHPPELALLALGLPGIDGIECAYRLKRIAPKLLIIIVADQAELAACARAFQVGVDGYFIMPGTRESLIETLTNAMAGWKPFTREVQKVMAEHFAHNSSFADGTRTLTPAEHKVMSYLTMELADKEIADVTGRSTDTIHSLTNSIFKKLRVHSRREAVGVFLGFTQHPYAHETHICHKR